MTDKKKVKLNRYDQLVYQLKIVEAEYQESLDEYQEELKEANLFGEPPPSRRTIDRLAENIGILHREIELLTDYAGDSVEEEDYGNDYYGGDYYY